jgi:hypothetical protein
MAVFTISDLKKHLGAGLGLRKNRYLLEIPVPSVEGEKLNVLCRSAGLPERNITPSEIFHKGRKYIMRGETDFVGSYEVSILDDSEMNIRRTFDKWLKSVDNSKPANQGIFSGGSYEEGVGNVLDNIKSGVAVANQAQDLIDNPLQTTGNFFLGLIDSGLNTPFAQYQVDINIWQLSGSGKKVYGYKLQNAFPTSLGTVTMGDEEENSLTEFSVVFSFSEFLALEGIDISEEIANTLLGDDAQDVISGIESFVK